MKIIVYFLLFPTEVGGRRNSIQSGYRPDWTIREDIKYCGAAILTKVPMKPGDLRAVELTPLVPENWISVKKNMIIYCYEGSINVGIGKVLEVIQDPSPEI